MQKKMLVIGDSHTLIWKEAPNTIVQHVGPALAFNLMKRGLTMGKWGLHVCSEIERIPLADISAIMVSFGEIDIRTRPDIDEVPYRLALFASLVHTKYRLPVIIHCPIASTWQIQTNPAYPILGTEHERNTKTLDFNQCVARYPLDDPMHKVYALNYARPLMDDHRRTRQCFYADDHHLNKDGLAIALETLKGIISTRGIGIDL